MPFGDHAGILARGVGHADGELLERIGTDWREAEHDRAAAGQTAHLRGRGVYVEQGPGGHVEARLVVGPGLIGQCARLQRPLLDVDRGGGVERKSVAPLQRIRPGPVLRSVPLPV